MIRACTLLLTLGLFTCCDAAEKKVKKTAEKPKLDDAATEAAKGHQWAEWVEPDFTAPRRPAPSEGEVGKGGMPESLGPALQNISIRSFRHKETLMTRHQALEFSIGGIPARAIFGSAVEHASSSPEAPYTCDVA